LLLFIFRLKITGTITEGEISKLYMRINSHLNSKSTNNKIIIHI